MLDLREIIDSENFGHTEASLLSPGYGTPIHYEAVMPVGDIAGETGQSMLPAAVADRGYGYADGSADIDDLLDKQTDGWSGPSLDGFQGVSYSGRPGYGVMNEQLYQSSKTSLGGFTIPSEEVGVGRAPGWRGAHYPHVEQHSLRREAYADQGHFGDGMPYFPDEGAAGQNRSIVRSPIHQNGLMNLGMDPDQRYIAPGSAIVEQPAGMSMSQILGQLGVAGWGIS